MISNIFDFGEREVHQLITPRTRVVGIPLGSGPQEVEQTIQESKHTRLPVYDGDLDHIAGILHVKDFIQWQLRGDVLLEQVNERHGTRLDSGEFDTLAGLIIEELGRPPEEGDVVAVDGARLEAVEVEGLAISRVRVVPADRAPENPREPS